MSKSSTELRLASCLAIAVMVLGPPAQAADLVKTFLGEDVLLRLSELGRSGSSNYSLTVDTNGFMPGRPYVTTLNVKVVNNSPSVSNGGCALTSSTPAGPRADVNGSGSLSSDWDVGARFVHGRNVKVEDVVSTTAPIPEPKVYAVIASALGLMGFVAHRRKRIVQ